MGSAPTGADSLATSVSVHMMSVVALMGKMQRARLVLILPPLLTPELCSGSSASIPTGVRAGSESAVLWSGTDTLICASAHTMSAVALVWRNSAPG